MIAPKISEAPKATVSPNVFKYKVENDADLEKELKGDSNVENIL